MAPVVHPRIHEERPGMPSGVPRSTDLGIKLSVCLITYNRADYLDLVLTELFSTRPFDFPFEVVLCDNHSDDRTPDVVADWSRRQPEIRPMRHKFNVGHENNIATAYRLAKGEYGVYLADDDRLVPEMVARIIAYMDAHPNIAACHSGKQRWDDVNKQVVGQHFTVAEETVFTKGGAVELFNFVIRNRIYPEIWVFRTAAMHRMHTITFNAYSPYVHLAHILDYGDVAFVPWQFYREVARSVIPGRLDHVGVQWSIHRRDSFLGGLEYLAQKAFRHLGIAGVPKAQVEVLQKMILDYNVEQLGLCVRLLMFMKNYRGAYEFTVRQQANGACDEAQAAEVRSLLIGQASAQALVETFESISILEEIAIMGVANADQLIERVGEQRPKLCIRRLTLDSLADVQYPDRTLVLVGEGDERQALLAAGFLPGLIVRESDLNRLFTL